MRISVVVACQWLPPFSHILCKFHAQNFRNNSAAGEATAKTESAKSKTTGLGVLRRRKTWGQPAFVSTSTNFLRVALGKLRPCWTVCPQLSPPPRAQAPHKSCPSPWAAGAREEANILAVCNQNSLWRWCCSKDAPKKKRLRCSRRNAGSLLNNNGDGREEAAISV